jgi:hypothetical protein
VGSKTYNGVWFSAYSHDHEPPHVHGEYAGITVLVELIDGTVRLAEREKPVRPPNAKRSHVNHVLRTAEKHADQLMEMWRLTHG